MCHKKTTTIYIVESFIEHDIFCIPHLQSISRELISKPPDEKLIMWKAFNLDIRKVIL